MVHVPKIFDLCEEKMTLMRARVLEVMHGHAEDLQVATARLQQYDVLPGNCRKHVHTHAT